MNYYEYSIPSAGQKYWYYKKIVEKKLMMIKTFESENLAESIPSS